MRLQCVDALPRPSLTHAGRSSTFHLGGQQFAAGRDAHGFRLGARARRRASRCLPRQPGGLAAVCIRPTCTTGTSRSSSSPSNPVLHGGRGSGRAAVRVGACHEPGRRRRASGAGEGGCAGGVACVSGHDNNKTHTRKNVDIIRGQPACYPHTASSQLRPSFTALADAHAGKQYTLTTVPKASLPPCCTCAATCHLSPHAPYASLPPPAQRCRCGAPRATPLIYATTEGPCRPHGGRSA